MWAHKDRGWLRLSDATRAQSTVTGMRRSNGQYIHDGEHVQFIAQPTFGFAMLAVVAVCTAQIAFEVVVGRWLRWLRPVARKTRSLAFSGAVAAMWAGCGFVILRIGGNLYIEGRWIPIEEIASVAGRGAPNPLHGNQNAVVCKDGSVIMTDVEPDTIRRIASLDR